MIDSHAHLDDNRFKKDQAQVIKNFEKNGVDLVVNIGADLVSSKSSVFLAENNERIYATVGVHPHDAKNYNQDVEDQLEMLSGREKVVAIGEIGLDYYYDFSPREIQKEVFWKQLELAKRVKMPVVIHSRDADQDTMDILKQAKKENPDLICLIHCYSGSVEMMREYVKMGFYIALGGATTFKNAKTPKKVAMEVPIENLLLETDSPYMTPEPNRGKRNEPKYVRLVAEQIANLRGMDVEEVISLTDKNTLDFYGIAL
ncbi:TatD family hydrolase [Peptoniphilus sp. KCTC 25270]|uniref:TatD family hydrolase n=1 Tax=Peptoniphilus sp. KCTC 25270 TaxID=2897414 RepID=UPI001E6263DB|nr:TatD family hydrolase [Peptoniphilus sp. KCTC 25270]MCD1146751.1 TatD family hydrolase [Peptoniphilus sp. KCTC 25270]